MSGTIRLHSKHGVAPVMTFCRICGKDAEEILLAGAGADKLMKEVYRATDGKRGNERGYDGSALDRAPARDPCSECRKYLDEGGTILIAKDIGQYLRLTKDMLDGMIGRVMDARKRVLDFEKFRSKVVVLEYAFWVQDEAGDVRLRNPKEWTDMKGADEDEKQDKKQG